MHVRGIDRSPLVLSLADGHGSEYMLLLDCLAVFKFLLQSKLHSLRMLQHSTGLHIPLYPDVYCQVPCKSRK